MASREERELVFRKGKWIDYPFEPCWNEYWLYTSDRILRKPLLRLEDVAAHLFLCARYHQDRPSSSEYTWAELAAAWFDNPAREKAARTIVSRLQAAGLLELQPGRGRGKRSRVTLYDPLLEADFRLAAAKGCFPVPAQDHVSAGITPAELDAFDFPRVREIYQVLKPRSFLRGRGWEPCLHAVFSLYLGELVDGKERDGQTWVPIPDTNGRDDAALFPWPGPALTRGRALVRLTAVPLLSLEAISLALWLRKRADQSRLQREPWVTVSVSQIRRQFHLRWTAVEALLAALEGAGLARRVGGGRQAGANKANVPLRFLLWDPCEKTADFLREVVAGEIHAQPSPLGAALAARLDPTLQPQELESRPLEAEGVEEKPSAREQGEGKPARREQGRVRHSKNPPNGNKGPAENPSQGNKEQEEHEEEIAPNLAPAPAFRPLKPPEGGQHEHGETNHRTTTTPLPAVVVDFLSEMAIAPEEIPPAVAPADTKEMVLALSAIRPGSPGYESRSELARAWLERGREEALLTYLATAAGIRSSVARQKGLAGLPFDYTRSVVEQVWEQVHGTPDYKYLPARVVRWLEARDPLPESRARNLRLQLPGDDAEQDQDTGAGPPDGSGATPLDERAAYVEMLGVPLDLAPWEQVLQEVRRLGLSVPPWGARALLDVHGPRRAGRGDAEVWLLVPGDVDLDEAGRYLWEDGVGKVVGEAVRRSSGVALPVAVGRYADLVGYLRRLRERGRAAWEQVKRRLAVQLPRSDYVTWVEQTQGGDLHLGDRRLVVHSPPAALHWLRQDEFLQKARREAQEVLGPGWSVEVGPLPAGARRRA